MPNNRSRALAATGAAVSILAFSAVLSVAPAHSAPLPEFCVAPKVVDDVCTVRLTSVTADAVDGTITGAPVGGGPAVILAGQPDAYLKSAGFGDAPPEPVQRWDATIDRVNNLDPSDPDSYGNAKARAFLPRTLNDLASQFPPDILVVRFAADDAQSGSFRLVSIQPTPQ